MSLKTFEISYKNKIRSKNHVPFGIGSNYCMLRWEFVLFRAFALTAKNGSRRAKAKNPMKQRNSEQRVRKIANDSRCLNPLFVIIGKGAGKLVKSAIATIKSKETL